MTTEIKPLQQKLQKDPNNAGLWCNLGVMLRRERHLQQAIICYRRALALKPDDAGILSNLGNALKDSDRIEEAVQVQQRAVQLAPDDLSFRFNYVVALREAKQFQRAATELDFLLTREPDNKKYRWEMALVLLYQCRFREGWAFYEARFELDDLPRRNFTTLQWQGENFEGKTLLLHVEQGYGDTILAARMIDAVRARGGKVILECKPEMQRLLAKLPVHRLVSPVQLQRGNVQYDLHCSLMSLFRIFDVGVDSIPAPASLNIPDEARAAARAILQPLKRKLNVGIVWSGSLTFADNAKRAASLADFLKLAEIEGVQLFSLQKGPREQDLQQQVADSFIVNLAPHLHDFADTAAFIEQLDCIVMTDSSVAHLAASLNKPVLNLLQYKPYWLYMPETESTPWYPSMRLIRQSQPGEWNPVFEAAATYLREVVNTKKS